VGRQTGIRHTPSLTFLADALPDSARTIADALARAAAADAEVQRRAQGAHYAGEADPYRRPAEPDEVVAGDIPSDPPQGT
jgi:ribosome-binding factor A